MGAHQRMFQRSRKLRQVGESHRGRIARQRVCQRDGGVAHRAVQFVCPLGQFGGQTARQLIRLVEKDVEQGNRNPQRTDDLDLIDIRGGQRLLGHQRRGRFDRFGQRQVDHLRDRRRSIECAAVRIHVRPQRGRHGLHRIGLGVWRRADAGLTIEVWQVQLDHAHRLGGQRDRHLRIVDQRLHLGGLVGQPHRLRRLQARRLAGPEIELEAHFRYRRYVGLRDRCTGQHGQLDLVAHRQFGHLRRRGGNGCRTRRGGRRHLRQDTGSAGRGVAQRDPAPIVAQRIGRTAHDAMLEAGSLPDGDAIDPAAQIVECFAAEFEQVVVGGRTVGHAGVVELLAAPRRLAEVLQPDHARAALQRVEGASHRGHAAQVARVVAQLRQRLARRLHHLARFLEEDVAHLMIVFEAGGARRGRRRRRRHRLQRRGLARLRIDARIEHMVHRPHDLRASLLPLGVGRCTEQRAVHLAGGTGHTTLIGRLGLSRQALEVAGKRRAVAARRAGHLRDRLRLLQQAALHRRRRLEGAEARRTLRSIHHRMQIAAHRVEPEQRLGHLRLHAEHVDEEAQRAQVVGQAVEGIGLDTLRGARVGGDQRVDVVAHAHHRMRGMVLPEHRQHAAHRRQLRWHRNQHLALARVAEVLVDVLLDLRQRGAQLLHHAAHRLAIGDATVQLLHPDFERAGRAALAHVVHALRQAAHAPGQFRMVEFDVLERGVHVQQCRWRLPSPARASPRRRIAASASRRSAAPAPAPRLADTASAATRRPARTARAGRSGAGCRHRPPPTIPPWPPPRACAPAPATTGRSGPGAGFRSPAARRCSISNAWRTAARRGPAGRSALGAAWAQKNSRSCARRSDGSADSPARSCASSRDASRLPYTSAFSSPLPWAS